MAEKKKNVAKLKSPLSINGTLKSTEIRKNKDGTFNVIQEIEVSKAELQRRLENLERAGGNKDLISSLKSILK